jgi:hypothetical protein
MTNTNRLTADARQQQLELAISRIERGRATKVHGERLSIATVAREAGVSPALIHNKYPLVAEAIREKQGRASRAQRDAKHDELKAEREKTRELRAAVDALEGKLATIASINRVLTLENNRLNDQVASKNVSVLAVRQRDT